MINDAMKRFYKEIGNMALTEGDKAICGQIAERIMENVMKQHIASCPHGKLLLSMKMLVFGAMLGSGIASGGIVFGLIKLFM